MMQCPYCGNELKLTVRPDDGRKHYKCKCDPLMEISSKNNMSTFKKYVKINGEYECTEENFDSEGVKI